MEISEDWMSVQTISGFFTTCMYARGGREKQGERAAVFRSNLNAVTRSTDTRGRLDRVRDW
jgi:hypothetical protein